MNYALRKSIGYSLSKCANTINQNLNKLLLPYGIAIEQRATLEIIKFEKDVTQTILADMLRKDKTTICRTLNALEKKGFITKSDSENDKRSKTIQLTSKGEEILQQTHATISAFRQQLSNKLSPEEITALFNSLDKLSS